MSTVPSQETLFAAGRKAYEIEQDAMGKALAAVDETAFLNAVTALSGAPRIAASGCGHSGIACMHFAHLMCCIERPARFLSPSEATHGASGYLQPGDVLLLGSDCLPDGTRPRVTAGDRVEISAPGLAPLMHTLAQEAA